MVYWAEIAGYSCNTHIIYSQRGLYKDKINSDTFVWMPWDHGFGILFFFRSDNRRFSVPESLNDDT
jgi:hypothetical protein